MPVPAPTNQQIELFPALMLPHIDAARTSSWHDTFADITFPAQIIDLAELGEQEEFLRWLEADSIFYPEGSEGTEETATIYQEPSSRSRSSSNASNSSSSSIPPVYRLPKLNAAIREAIKSFGGAAFPKLNWTSPKDAAFILPQASYGPLYCTTPSDIYLLLKSSDFVTHDIDPITAHSGLDANDLALGIKPKIELVLKKFESLNPSREVRAFVRENVLVGVSQRDMNFYDHLQPQEIRDKVVNTVREFWLDEIRDNYEGGANYTFDLYLTPNYEDATIIDFQPYRQSTDALLFTYEQLHAIAQAALSPSSSSSPGSPQTTPTLPILRIIESQAHPSVTRNAPTYQTSMMPLEMIELGEGRNMAEFKEAWDEAVRAGMEEEE
ncbi:hypothetical protein L202_07558 [Cryptococcus amylolentus CBS 6039]|uniref:Uncharacterized protein n=1 Tax=Cryptococcus amylolentus CBS 6039 TaxID=1295533 RepID=A0A1E3HCM7_9TREE|nr:hypothetical protein L202_07558 [Cryptococcus amylolentus CBS 6039]ODN74098.1 hypothetical protein L202_07558 [Cryptococcus amylolentus CBS 6039]